MVVSILSAVHKQTFKSTKQKKLFFPINGDNSAQKLGKKEKNHQNPFQAILKKWHGPLSH